MQIVRPRMQNKIEGTRGIYESADILALKADVSEGTKDIENNEREIDVQ